MSTINMMALNTSNMLHYIALKQSKPFMEPRSLPFSIFRRPVSIIYYNVYLMEGRTKQKRVCDFSSSVDHSLREIGIEHVTSLPVLGSSNLPHQVAK